MAETLNFIPDKTSKRSHAPRVKRVEFGNGYSQKYGDGINSDLESWSMVFTAHTEADRNTLVNFFKANYLTYFFWQSPETDETLKPYECLEWDVSFLGAGNYTINATFREWPGLFTPP